MSNLDSTFVPLIRLQLCVIIGIMGSVLSSIRLLKEQKKRKRERKRYFSQKKETRNPRTLTDVTLFQLRVMREQASLGYSVKKAFKYQSIQLPESNGSNTCIDRKCWRESRPREMKYIGRDKKETEV